MGAALALAVTVAGGCDGSDPTDPPAPPPSPGDVPFVPPTGGTPLAEVTTSLAIEYVPCQLYETVEFPEPREGGTACGFVKVPILWSDRAAGSIRLMLRHLPAYGAPPPFPGPQPPTGPAKGAVWLVPGGPGLSTVTMNGDARELSEQGYDVYLLDHRGTGRSTPLVCPDAVVASEADYIARCAAALTEVWGSRLAGFSTTEAARDLGELIAATRRPNEKVYVYGHSYGTFLLHRYLELYPDQVTGAVLAGVVSPQASMHTFPEGVDGVIRSYLAGCAGQGTCGSKLGADPPAVLDRVLKKLETPGYCATRYGFTRADYKEMLFELGLDAYALANVAPFLYRLDRCSAEDIASIEYATGAYGAPGTESSAYGASVRFADGLYYNIVLSELFPDPPPTTAELEAQRDSVAATTDFAFQLRAAWESWPRYRRDEHYGKAGSPTLPTLIIHGTLDPNTPYEAAQETAQEHYSGASHRFLTLTGYGHNANDTECAEERVLGFFANPTAPVAACPARDLTNLYTAYADRGPLTDFRTKLAPAEGAYEGAPLVNTTAFPNLPAAAPASLRAAPGGGGAAEPARRARPARPRPWM